MTPAQSPCADYRCALGALIQRNLTAACAVVTINDSRSANQADRTDRSASEKRQRHPFNSAAE
jgi:hypothetical protein